MRNNQGILKGRGISNNDKDILKKLAARNLLDSRVRDVLKKYYKGLVNVANRRIEP